MSLVAKLARIETLKEEQKQLSTEVKSELKKMRSKLPKDWRKQLTESHPEFDNFNSAVTVTNVLNGRTVDNEIIKALETICNNKEKV